MYFDQVVAFDSATQSLSLIYTLALHEDEDALEAEYDKAAEALEALRAILLGPAPSRAGGQGSLLAEPQPQLDEAAYVAGVRRAQAAIAAGELQQVVLANRLSAPFRGSLLDSYRVLRGLNPSPYMFFLSSPRLELAGASPETLVRVVDGQLTTFPLAGTRRRGADETEDAALEHELLHDAKERAEHDMLVDAACQDLEPIAAPGSIAVEDYARVQRYSHVMHIASTVGARLAEGRDALDALWTLLPAGTLSGAPRPRACALIAEIEGEPRGLYGGALGYIDLAGNLDMCIAIRFALARDGEVEVRAGAGIVAASDPQREYRECLAKAGASLSALRRANEGVDP